MKTESKHTRLLAAVMFVDIVGYTAIMQQAESEAVRYRKLFRTVINKQVPEYQGSIVQYYGDGALGIFRSAFEAVRCAIKIQEILKKISVPVRIGLHQGDIVHTGDGIYGNAVNVASRIESLAHTGGILISEKINEEIRNHRKIQTRPVGCFAFKNVNRHVKIYSIVQKDAAFQKNAIEARWSELHSMQVRTALVRPYLSSHNPGLLN